ncbi:putative inner mitochondrial membrane protein Mpv17/PMP22 superfamily member [Andalucia godoyi]|uniref:Putative inner mitochondrial membrane protein Mpv17/PMP22 superfamily member n=1 Tax=Andalucia godoyi TaxID=505711 RepID=A0A8K0AHM8_ANDGO|nr:putative inner mitochondrial membrane protein Mpv17/PMP22 superfamily member [Andalucia godoyi]|eukprot:ANDGO_03138.mRNA.1 putative inner mitochondrial membrane protein Mpv17/PMP22 superfamily member
MLAWGASFGKRVMSSPSWLWYMQQLEDRPILVKATTTSIAYGMSNAIVQTYYLSKGEKHEFSLREMAVNAGIGFAAGAAFHGWYGYLDLLPVRIMHAWHKVKIRGMYSFAANLGFMNNSSFQTVYQEMVKTQITPRLMGKKAYMATKLIADELVFSSLFLCFYYSVLTSAMGGSLQDAKEKVFDKFGAAYVTDMAIFLPLQFLNFKYVPVMLQPLVVTLGNFFFSTALNIIGHDGPHEKAKKPVVCSCCGRPFEDSPVSAIVAPAAPSSVLIAPLVAKPAHDQPAPKSVVDVLIAPPTEQSSQPHNAVVVAHAVPAEVVQEELAVASASQQQ